MSGATHDTEGRLYAKLSELKIGDIIELDSEFTCVPGRNIVVWVDEQGPYFKCSHGKHHLDGQADDGEHCVGVYLVKSNNFVP